jgi:ribose transport system permease protein/erythritol transport system permease protein
MPESSAAAARVPIWQAGWFNTLARFAALALVFAFFAALVEDGRFYSARNLENIGRQSTVYALAALGATLVIISGGIDLSVGAIIALAVVAVASVLNLHGEDAAGGTVYLLEQYPTLLPILALGAGLLVSTLAGLANGGLIVSLRLVPFIVTLGTMGIFRGLAKGIADERDLYPPQTWLTGLMDPTLTSSDRRWMLLPPGVWVLIVAACLAALALRYTRFGRHVYAIGSNEETARLCGVPVLRTKVMVYTLAGLFAGLAGLMQFSFISGIGQPTTGVSYELFVIAAVVIGGGSLMGGEGTILGSVIGALLITILYMGGQQMGWPKWVQEMVIGAIIIGAVAIDQVRHRRAA